VGESERVAHGGKISGMNEISLAKATIRKQILTLRKGSNPSNEALTKNLLAVVDQLKPSRVGTYLSYPSEPSTTDLIENLIDRGIPVLVPETVGENELEWHEVISGSQTSLTGGDLLFIPAVAVDESGNRLGRGKGYFDRELSGLEDVIVYAVVFESEVLESIPVEEHDQRVDGVVTQEQIRKIN
jgi:5-formyltetrahydrofolate cyclo-ligase